MPYLPTIIGLDSQIKLFCKPRQKYTDKNDTKIYFILLKNNYFAASSSCE
jgi:hypothetical protein